MSHDMNKHRFTDINVKKIYICCILFITLILSCSSVPETDEVPFRYFDIAFEQDGTEYRPVNGEVHLKKKPFSIIITFTGPDCIFINADGTDATLKQAQEGLPVEKLNGFSKTLMSEELFNSGSHLILSGDSAAFWCFTSAAENNFNSSSFKNSMYICRRDVLYLASDETLTDNVPVEKSILDSLYLTFMKLEWTSDYTGRIEKKRLCLTIRF